MGSFAVGDIVMVPFPYADFSRFKLRPALVAGKAEFNNLILCQITSKAITSKTAVSLREPDFSHGFLGLDSYVRPDKLVTIERSLIERKVGALERRKLDSIRSRIRGLFV